MIRTRDSTVKLDMKKLILVVLIFAILSTSVPADVVVVKANAKAFDKDYFSLDSRRAKVAGQQEEEFKEERPWPIAETLGLILLVGVVVVGGAFAHNN